MRTVACGRKLAGAQFMWLLLWCPPDKLTSGYCYIAVKSKAARRQQHPLTEVTHFLFVKWSIDTMKLNLGLISEVITVWTI